MEKETFDRKDRRDYDQELNQLLEQSLPQIDPKLLELVDLVSKMGSKTPHPINPIISTSGTLFSSDLYA